MREYRYVIRHTAEYIRFPVGCGRKEIDAHELMYGRMHFLKEEVRKLPGLAFADKYTYDLMAVSHKHPFERDRLRKVSPALSLYNKKILHSTIYQLSGTAGNTISLYFTIAQLPS